MLESSHELTICTVCEISTMVVERLLVELHICSPQMLFKISLASSSLPVKSVKSSRMPSKDQ